MAEILFAVGLQIRQNGNSAGLQIQHNEGCVKIGIQSSYGREIQQIYTNLTNQSADTQNERFWMDL